MGIFKTKITDNYLLGIWKIEESLDFFHQKYELSAQELTQYSQLRHEEKQIERMAGRVLIKELLSSLSQTCYGVLNNEKGKPYLIDQNYELSISHSKEYVAVIISLNEEAVGIDIQLIEEKISFVAPRLFTEQEMNDCQTSLTKKCLYWSAKEALYKIHQRKQLNFKKDLKISPFELKKEGTFTGFLQKKSHNFLYQVWDNYVLVYSIP
ncbi:MAG: 4'-phosphopantetheinyl transferase superfamily protein [Cytophagales bacterium]|nr:4'-phosphopantetheinyl transferase superfamily protein [Cytophagales bacterium]